MIRVLVVDDSAVFRTKIAGRIALDPALEIAATAPDAYVARDKIVLHSPDVVVLDAEMPGMDGMTFLEKIMRHHPLPVVFITPAEGAPALAARASELGAVECICRADLENDFERASVELIKALKLAYASSSFIRETIFELGGAAFAPPEALGQPVSASPSVVIAIGASTGGPQAIEAVLAAMPEDSPATLIVQHMPENFTAHYARRLDEICAMQVREARDNDVLRRGLALLAPGGRHMVLKKYRESHFVRIRDGHPVNHQKPSVDMLFQSVALSAGARAVGVLLTGMGSDGAKGLLAMRLAGARTIAQDERTSMIFGMPAEAIKLGAACEVTALGDIARAIVRSVQARGCYISGIRQA